MKEINSDSLKELRELYLNDDYHSMKALFSKLIRVKRKLINYNPIIVCENDNSELKYINSLEKLEVWINKHFRLISAEIKKETKSILNEDVDFPNFKEFQITADMVLNRAKMKRIKKLSIYGVELPLKQNFQKIENIVFKEEDKLLAIDMSNKASIKVYNPKDIFDSKYELRIEEVEKIEFTIKDDFWEFIKKEEEIIIFKNDVLEDKFNGKSIFLDSLGILK